MSMIPLHAIFHDVYYTSIFFNIITSSIAIYILVFKICKKDNVRMLLIIIMMLSRSFISFTTSGLENSLIFLLLSIFYYYFFKQDSYNKKHLILLSFIFSLVLINRLDTVLLVFPSLLYAFIKRDKNISFINGLIYIFIGVIPFILWELFSLVYYGFLFPNTYYAKVSSGISKIEYIIQGLKYYYYITILDFVTVIFIFISLLCMLIKYEKKYIGLIIGLILNLLYIVYVGGDFMLGRFLTAPLFTAMIGLSFIDFTSFNKIIIYISILLLVLGSLISAFIFYSTKPTDYENTGGIALEQSFYFPHTSFLAVGSEKKIKKRDLFDLDRYTISNYENGKSTIANNIYVGGSIGFNGYFAKDDDIIIDYLALADPLLSRIPLKGAKLTRIGHLEREIPDNYLRSIALGDNVISDQEIREYYNKLKIITQDRIFSRKI